MKHSMGANTILYPTPVLIIGSYDDQGRPNMMCVAWAGICSSQPPSVAISVREATYTYGNIVRTQSFTVNVPSASQAKQADYVGIYSGRDEDKFVGSGFTAVKSDLVDAPYIEECPIVLECHVRYTFDLGLHKQFVGEILDVKADESIMNEKGAIDVSKIDPFMFSPSDGSYYRMTDLIGKAFSMGKKSHM